MIVHGRIFEGRFRFFPEPTDENLIRCKRCGGNKGRVFEVNKPEGDTRLVWFCMNNDCLQLDSVIVKQ